jgi:hypothetical protein
VGEGAGPVGAARAGAVVDGGGSEGEVAGATGEAGDDTGVAGPHAASKAARGTSPAIAARALQTCTPSLSLTLLYPR